MIKVDRREIIFFLGYIVYVFSLVLDISVWAEPERGQTLFVMALKAIRYFSYALMLLKLLLDQIKQRNIWYMAILVALLLLATIGSENKTYLFYGLFVLAAKDININRILKVTMAVQLLGMSIVMGACAIGILPDYVFDVTTRVRHSYGFVWTTMAPILFFFLTLQYLYLRREKLRVLEAVVLEIIHLAFYIKTDARMCFAMATLMVVFFWGLKFWKRYFAKEGKEHKIFLLVPAALCLFSVLGTYFYTGQGLYAKINAFISNRLQLGQQGIKQYGISLFGTFIEWVGNNYHGLKKPYNYVDCSYVQIMLEYGVVTLALIVACYTFIIYRGIKRKDIYLVWTICFVLMFGITEPRLVNFAFHPFPLMAAALLSNSENMFWERAKERMKVRHIFQTKRKKIEINW